jgi:hypothetical protein
MADWRRDAAHPIAGARNHAIGKWRSTGVNDSARPNDNHRH